jgi:hypothetical protein
MGAQQVFPEDCYALLAHLWAWNFLETRLSVPSTSLLPPSPASLQGDFNKHWGPNFQLGPVTGRL